MGNKIGSEKNLDTLPKCVQYLADKYPNKELFVFYNGEKRRAFTSRQMFQLAGKFAHRLRHQYGFKKGDVVANTLPNSPERLITDLGTTLAGCICLNGQLLLTDGEDFFLNARKSRASAVVLVPEEGTASWRLIKPYVQGAISPHTFRLSCDRAADLTMAITVSRRSTGEHQPFLDELESSKEQIFVDSSVQAGDTLHVFTTSGSTGYSKLVPRTHTQAIFVWGELMDELIRSEKGVFRGPHVYYNDRPLGWLGGYPVNTYTTGCKRVLLDAFDIKGQRPAESMWRAITQEKCTDALILPLDLDHLIRYVREIGGSEYKLRTLGCGGQPLQKHLLLNISAIADEILVVYGSTESCILTYATVSPQDYQDFICGKLADGATLKIVDGNNEECKPGEVGLILAKAAQIFRGYFNRLEDPDPNNAKAFTEDGWHITEDMGYFDENGRLFVLGRDKDTIMFGSAVVYPGWLERRVIEHPDIAKAVVVPVSDPVLFHDICACVVPVDGRSLTEENLKEFCEKMFITDTDSEGVPMPKFFLILKDFPQTLTGKPDKQRIRAMAEEKFGYKENGN